MRRLAILVLATMGLSAVVGCQSGVAVVPGTGPLLTVQLRGGLCADGGSCDRTVIVERDGRVHAATKPPNVLGVVPAARLSWLAAAIAGADYAAIMSRPFTGDCPVNVDGQEIIFEFAAPRGTERIASCEVDVDWGSPLFMAVTAALGEWVPLPTT